MSSLWSYVCIYASRVVLLSLRRSAAIDIFRAPAAECRDHIIYVTATQIILPPMRVRLLMTLLRYASRASRAYDAMLLRLLRFAAASAIAASALRCYARYVVAGGYMLAAASCML